MADTTPQQTLASNKINDTANATGWNFPRHHCGVNDPSTSDDETLGFWYGSMWANISTPTMFYCVDPSEGAALWQPMANA